MNPCPCGYQGNPSGQCRCTSEQVQRYQSRLSGPLLDRIDMCVSLSALAIESLQHEPAGENSAKIRKRVLQAQWWRVQRMEKTNVTWHEKTDEERAGLGKQEKAYLQKALLQLRLSPRSYYKLLRVARTIADLDQSDMILKSHLGEALSFRAQMG